MLRNPVVVRKNRISYGIFFVWGTNTGTTTKTSTVKFTLELSNFQSGRDRITVSIDSGFNFNNFNGLVKFNIGFTGSEIQNPTANAICTENTLFQPNTNDGFFGYYINNIQTLSNSTVSFEIVYVGNRRDRARNSNYATIDISTDSSNSRILSYSAEEFYDDEIIDKYEPMLIGDRITYYYASMESPTRDNVIVNMLKERETT